VAAQGIDFRSVFRRENSEKSRRKRSVGKDWVVGKKGHLISGFTKGKSEKRIGGKKKSRKKRGIGGKAKGSKGGNLSDSYLKNKPVSVLRRK